VKTFITSILFFSVFASSAAMADTRTQVNPALFARHTLLVSRILTVNMSQRDTGFPVHGGQIAIDLQAREVTLTLEQGPTCPPGRFCSMIAVAPRVIKLALGSVQQDNCGTVDYKAMQDLRTVDGDLETIEVRDNTRNRCESMVARNATDIVLTIVPARASFNEEEVSTFTGTALQQTLAPIPGDLPMNAR
jgi:hypothetical protein